MLSPGDRVDGWVIEQRLGAGGMGSVYRCRNASTERIFAALKVLETPLRDSPEAHQRFVREAEILARLDHPGIVRVRNVRIDAETPYLEMEFVEGMSLEARIHQGPVPLPEALGWMEQLADAVCYLHDRGVRHRDLKPANVIVTPDGRLKLVDFGLALETELNRITAEGLNFGTVSYAPPEWIDPEKLDPVQWDLYALGVLLYELLTGTPAFPMSGEGPLRKQLLQVMMVKQSSPPLDPGPAWPESVRSLVRELTATTPAERPKSANELMERLLAIRDGGTLDLEGASPGGPGHLVQVTGHLQQASRSSKAARWGWLVVPVVLGLGCLGVGGWFASDWFTPPPPSPPPVVEAPEPPPEAPPPPRSVDVIADGWRGPLHVRAGEVSAVLPEANGVFSGLPDDAVALSWAAGAECGTCPEICPDWCGSGVVDLPDTGPVQIPIAPGRARVTVTLPSLADEKAGGPFKKKRPIWHVEVRLDDARGLLVNHYTARFEDVLPGRHKVVAEIGGCPPEAEGCWPDGECPARCRSEVSEVVVPWIGGSVGTRIKVPPPP